MNATQQPEPRLLQEGSTVLLHANMIGPIAMKASYEVTNCLLQYLLTYALPQLL